MLSKPDLASWEHQKGSWVCFLNLSLQHLASCRENTYLRPAGKLQIFQQIAQLGYSWDETQVHTVKHTGSTHNATWFPKFLQMCLNIIIKILVRLSYCYFNPGKRLVRYCPTEPGALNTRIFSQHHHGLV